MEAAVVAIDPNGTVTYASSYFEDLFGIRMQDFIGGHFTSLMSPTERHIAMLLLEQMTAGACFPIATWLLRRGDGTSIWVESRVTIIRDVDETVTGYITVTARHERAPAGAADADAHARELRCAGAACGCTGRVPRRAQPSACSTPTRRCSSCWGYDTREELLALDLAQDVYADASDHEWLVRTAQAGELDDWSR